MPAKKNFLENLKKHLKISSRKKNKKKSRKEAFRPGNKKALDQNFAYAFQKLKSIKKD